MKKFMIVVVLTAIIGSTTLSAGPRRSLIVGQVVESENYTPANTATVSVSGNDGSIISNVTTNENGLFELTSIPYGEYEISVSYLGHKNLICKIHVEGSITDMGVMEVDQDKRVLSQNINYSQNSQYTQIQTPKSESAIKIEPRVGIRY